MTYDDFDGHGRAMQALSFATQAQMDESSSVMAVAGPDAITIPDALSGWFTDGNSPWTDLPDIGARPTGAAITGAYNLFQDYEIAADSVQYFENVSNALVPGMDFLDVTNHGTLWTEATQGEGLTAAMMGSCNWFTNTGTVTVLSQYGDASGFVLSGQADGLNNSGTIQVVAHGSATGFEYNNNQYGYEGATNSGTIDVWSETGQASAVVFTYAEGFHNTGSIIASGYTQATAFEMDHAQTTLVNDGLIKAVTSTGAGIAVHLDPGANFTLENNGTIEGDIRLETFETAYSGDTIRNNGLIDGSIYTSRFLFNEGTITGDVHGAYHNEWIDNSKGTIEGVISLGGGSDHISGGAGAEAVRGGDGDDRLWGGAGNDSLNGDAQNDFVRGDSGEDTVQGGLGSDQVYGGSENDLVMGDGGNDTLGGGAGDDTLEGGAGDDLLCGGRDDEGADVLWGGDGNDRLYGGNGNDTLYGDDGDDRLWGSVGDDVLTGGAGADTFTFRNNEGNDTVTDFNTDEDTLVFSNTVTHFTDLASVQAAATATEVGGEAGVLIDTGGGTSVFLEGLTLDDLTHMTIDYLF